MASDKFKFFRSRIASINKSFRAAYYNDILLSSTNSKTMWDNINFIITKKSLKTYPG